MSRQVINLRVYYPEVYKENRFLEVSSEVAKALRESERQEQAYRRRLFRHQAYFSLDRNDGIEKEAICSVPMPEEIYEAKQTRELLYWAVGRLPRKQARRLYAYFWLEMSVTEIAEMEFVSQSRVYDSIRRGVKNLSGIWEKVVKEA